MLQQFIEDDPDWFVSLPRKKTCLGLGIDYVTSQRGNIFAPLSLLPSEMQRVLEGLPVELHNTNPVEPQKFPFEIGKAIKDDKVLNSMVKIEKNLSGTDMDTSNANVLLLEKYSDMEISEYQSGSPEQVQEKFPITQYHPLKRRSKRPLVYEKNLISFPTTQQNSETPLPIGEMDINIKDEPIEKKTFEENPYPTNEKENDDNKEHATKDECVPESPTIPAQRETFQEIYNWELTQPRVKQCQIQSKFNVNRSTYYRWKKKYLRDNNLEPSNPLET